MNASGEPAWVHVFRTAPEDQVLELVEKGAPLEPWNDVLPLNIAVSRDLVRVARALLERGASPNDPITTSSSGARPVCTWVQSRAMAELMTAHGARWDAGLLGAALDGAARESPDDELVAWLVERGARPSANAWMGAMMDGRDIPPRVLAAAEPDVRDALLAAACGEGRADVAVQLLGLGADPGGADALHSAAEANQPALLRLLVEHGADVNARGRYGHRALVGAAFEGATDAVRALLDLGADPGAPNDHGQTALDGAIECGDEVSQELLREALQRVLP